MKKQNDLMTFEEANDFKIDASLTPAKAYYELTNNKLVPFITAGVTEAVRKYSEMVEAGEAEDCNVSVDLGTTMKFYFGEDECEGEPFFEFELGPVYDRSMELQKAMEANRGASYSHALSNLFEDACPKLSEDLFDNINFILWVPDVGGDPYIEVFNGEADEDEDDE